MKIEIDHMMATATFFVNAESESSKTTYKGPFKVRCVLSPLQLIHSDSLYRQLLGKDNPQFANSYISGLCYAISQLKYRIIESPDWFKSEESSMDGSGVDDNILLYILEQAVQAEENYRKDMEEKYEKAKESVKKAVDDGSLTNGEELNDIDGEEE